MSVDNGQKTKEELRPFETDEEYLEALYALLDLILFSDPGERMALYEDYRGETAGEWLKKLRIRLLLSEQGGFTPALETVLLCSGLPYYMRLPLVYVLRISLEPVYERDAAGEFWKESLTLSDLLRIVMPLEDTDAAVPSGSEIFRLIEEALPGLLLLFPQLSRKDMPGALTPVMDRRLAALCMGEAGREGLPCGMYYLEESLSEGSLKGREASRKGDPETEENPQEGSVEEVREKLLETRIRLAGTLLEREASMPPEISVLWGQEGSGKKSVMKRLAAASGKKAVVLPLHDRKNAVEDPEDPFYPDAELLIRECLLTGSIPVIDGVSRIGKDAALALCDKMRAFLGTVHTVYLLADAEEVPDHLSDAFYLEMPKLRTSDRILLWKQAIGEEVLPEESIIALSNTFALTPGQIRRCAAQAFRLAGPERKITEDILYHVCYALLGHPLKQHSQRVKSSFTWDDLKMAPRDKVVLRDLCMAVRSRHVVMQEWGFERKVPYGAGITALFAGPPGTGKTMAAQVVANELHMELYKIDVSQLIDKYVGETEKNIRRVFEQAKISNSVLFFDEADAIFNKRLEAKNSNERFANIESSLLLQCIEEYDGVALLATNNMAAIDAAFIRRFRFYLTFKEPDEKIRREIWESVFPKETPLSDEVDLKELAHIFNFNGAIIKNVALQSAYLAAQQKKPIGLLEILVAVRRELEKNQRVLAVEKMGRLGYMLPEVLNWSDKQ